MTLIKSISGIRGTIGGRADEGLTPLDVVKLTSAYAALIRKTTTKTSNKIVVGRDARLSGDMVNKIVCGTLMGMGFDVVDIGLAGSILTHEDCHQFGSAKPLGHHLCHFRSNLLLYGFRGLFTIK